MEAKPAAKTSDAAKKLHKNSTKWLVEQIGPYNDEDSDL
jgi:hypothetical protein